MSNICPAAEACPIFSGVLKDKSITTAIYKAQYCEAGERGKERCRRWQCKIKFGKVPENLLPNSNKSLEQIAQENNWD